MTRFSGVTGTGAAARIDLNGTVGSILDLRNPAQPPLGQHWLNEPQRLPVSAGQVGQIFGVALDGASPPNIYFTATSAFGLHRNAANSDWMDGMWGEGGPGAVYKLSAENDYRPELFARIELEGRSNSGAALGNIAYDRWHDQLLVSDLETGMIHRISIADGADSGHYDHGSDGRAAFYDSASGAQSNLPAVAFDPDTSARITGCTAGNFAQTPACWNVADFRRRVWGLGLREDADTGEVRLYYAIWSSDGLGNPEFAAADADEKRNSLWSIALTQEGDFDTASVVREFFLPEFFSTPADIARAGQSHAVTDIAFPRCSAATTMILAERGGLRNLGLGVENAFSFPHESRVLRYSSGETGLWEVDGRYDVGFYARNDRNAPHLRANSAGGVAFGMGYASGWRIDPSKPDAWLWMSGDALCAPFGACFNPATGRREDGSQVHGVQGNDLDSAGELQPDGSMGAAAVGTDPYPPAGPLKSYMVDSDINVDGSNRPIMSELNRNDATRIGDIEIYQPCAGEEAGDVDEGQTDEGEVDEGETPPTDEVVPPDETMPPDEDLPPDGIVPPGDEELPPDLEKVKDGPAECVAGGLCSFTVTITNNGPGIWSGPLFEHDTLPAGSILLNYGPQPDWVCNQAGGSIDCEHAPVTLAPGDSVTLTMDIIVPPGYAGEFENCIADVWQPEGPGDDPAVIEAVEQRLNALGFNPGPIDGVLDPQTQTAITDFQNANGLDPTGDVTDDLRDVLFPDMAGLPGDADPTNDGDCHVVLVTPPQPQPILGPMVPPAPPPVIIPPAPIVVDPGPTPGPTIVFIDPGHPTCPPGTVRRGNRCFVIVRDCPRGTVWRHGRCVRIVQHCPRGTVLRHGRCVRITVHCPPNTVLRHGRCVKIAGRCPEGTVRRGNRCVRITVHCPPNTVLRHGRCVKIAVRCPEGTVRRGNRCVKIAQHCPRGTVLRHGRCVKTTIRCPRGTVLRGNRCVKTSAASDAHCPAGTVRRGGRCVKIQKPSNVTCPRGTVRRGNRCVKIAKPANVHCPRGTVRRGNRCVKIAKPATVRCPKGTVRRGNRCVRVAKPVIKRCPAGTVRRGNRCVRVVRKVKPVLRCPKGTVRRGNRCVRVVR